MNDPTLGHMKDFLQIFNKISETCFKHCVNTFADRETSDEEVECVDRCVNKYLGVNHKVMGTYVEIQPEMVQRRIEEMEKKQRELEEIEDDETVKHNQEQMVKKVRDLSTFTPLKLDTKI